MIDFESVLAEARTMATSATHATARTNTGLEPALGFATILLPHATNQDEQNTKANAEANVASSSKQQSFPPPAPDLESSKIAKVAEAKPNEYCDEQTFGRYGNQMAIEWGLDRVQEVFTKALTLGINQEQAWDIAEAMAIFEFIGDGRHACFECPQYRHGYNTAQGICTAAGTTPLKHMTRGATVKWDWLNRCPMHPARNPMKPEDQSK